jgi:Ran GTPase-activating protein (RanGAP) involved in mRNA processing and transport
LGRLRSLEIHLARWDAEPVRRLCESPHAQELRRLSFPFAGLTAAGTSALVGSPLFPRLEELDLSYNNYGHPVGQTFGAALDHAKGPFRLKRLNLASTRFGPREAERLAACSALASLTHLEIGPCASVQPLRERGYRALAESPYLARLQTLGLMSTGPQSAGIRALINSTRWTELRSLDLSGNRIGPKSGPLLAETALLKGLMVLELDNNGLADKTAQAIAESPYLTGLVVVNLRRANITDGGAVALLNSPNMANVVLLNLSDNLLTPSMIKAFKDRFEDRVVLPRVRA